MIRVFKFMFYITFLSLFGIEMMFCYFYRTYWINFQRIFTIFDEPLTFIVSDFNGSL